MIVRTVLSVTCLLVTYAAAYVILSGKGDFPRADTAVLWTDATGRRLPQAQQAS